MTKEKTKNYRTKFQVSIDHAVSDSEHFLYGRAFDAKPENPRFANRYEEIREKMEIAASRAAIVTWQEENAKF